MREGKGSVERIDTGLNVTLEFRSREAIIVGYLDGYLDNANTPKFLAFARELLERPSTQALGFDLGGLTYTSSTGVGALSTLTMEASQKARLFFLGKIPEKIEKVFQLLGIMSFYTILDHPYHITLTEGSSKKV